MTVKVLLDTDIGTDIDDAICLSYLLAQPECELLGITTVTGEADKRAMIASALCKAAKRDIPIYPGCDVPILGSQRQKIAQQAKVLPNWDHQKVFDKGYAVEFLRKTIRKYPGEITLLSIGPLTNIGLLFSVDPEIPRLLKGLVLMGGIFTTKLSGVGILEWNILCDPYAASIVYKAPVPIHKSIGLDVTMQVTMEVEQLQQYCKTPVMQPLLDISKVWYEYAKHHITFHDPLATLTIFDDKVCEFKKGTVDVELASDRLRGYTYWQENETEGTHEIALAVDRERFFKSFFSVF